LKVHIFNPAGKRFIPSEDPSLRLETGPKIISLKRNVPIYIIGTAKIINSIMLNRFRLYLMFRQ
jgi:hypothetical protein